MTLRARLASLTLGLLLAVGCVDYQETIEVLPDGRIELTIFATVVDAARPAIENRPGMREMLKIPDSRQQALRRLPAGFGLKHWVVSRAKGYHIYDVSVTAPNADALREWLGGMSGDQKIEIVDDGNRILYRRTLPPSGGRPAPQFMQLFSTPADKARMAFRMIVPTEFIETNGVRDGRKISVWQADLGTIRNKGLVMEATIRKPGLLDATPPWLVAAIAALVGVSIGVIVLRRRRRP